MGSGVRVEPDHRVQLKQGANKILLRTMDVVLDDGATGELIDYLGTGGLWNVQFDVQHGGSDLQYPSGKNHLINRRYLEIQGGSKYSWTRKFDDIFDATGSSDDGVQPFEIHLESESDRSSGKSSPSPPNSISASLPGMDAFFRRFTSLANTRNSVDKSQGASRVDPDYELQLALKLSAEQTSEHRSGPKSPNFQRPAPRMGDEEQKTQ